MYKKISLTTFLIFAIGTSSIAYAKPVKPNAQMEHVLDTLAALKPKPIETLSAEEARKQPTPADAVKKIMKEKDIEDANKDVRTKNIMIDGAKGKIAARVYIPSDVKSKPLPVVLYFHGGGFVIADLDVYDATPRAIAKDANVIVVSAHYRQAPEDKFPAAHDDAFAAYKWLIKNANEFNGDDKKIAVMGESAGANLAINVAIAARDNKIQPPLYQVLIYPVAGTDMETASYQENANAKPLNKAMMAWFVKNTIRTEADKNDPRLNLVGKANLKNLPETLVITAEIDPLRSEGELLASKLKAEGVNVESKNYNGVTHEFLGMGAVVKESENAEKFVSEKIKDALNR